MLQKTETKMVPILLSHCSDIKKEPVITLILWLML